MAVKVWGAGSSAGVNGQWSTGSNWTGNTIPANGDDVVFDAICPNPLQSGPTSNVTIANFTVNFDSVSSGYSFAGGVVYITGNMANNNSANNGFFLLDGVGFEGVTSVVGTWKSNRTFSRVNDGVYGSVITFNIANMVFNHNNYIEFANIQSEVTICRPSIGAGARPFVSITIENSPGFGVNFYNFNFQNSRILTQAFNLNNTTLNITGNDLTSYPSSQFFTNGAVICDEANLNFTESTFGDVFNTPFVFGPSNQYDFLFQARVTNLKFNMNSTQLTTVNFGNQFPSDPNGVDPKIFVGFYAPTGDVELNIRGTSFFGLNQGGVFNGGNVNTSKFTYNTGSINVYNTSGIGVFAESTITTPPYDHPVINFYDESIMSGKSILLCNFFDKSRVSPQTYNIQVYNVSFLIFIQNFSDLSTFRDQTNKNSTRSSF